jgi:hypothetical protein
MVRKCGLMHSLVRPHMHPYSFDVSLRANHPTMDLNFLSDVLGMERRYGWANGAESVTPKGRSLGWTRDQSYWSARITVKETSSEEQQLEDVLNKSLELLEQHEGKLREFISAGGSLNYFIGLYGSNNFGLIFTPKLLNRFATAGVEIQLDVYPSKSSV